MEATSTQDATRGLWDVADAATFLKSTVNGVYKLVERRMIPHVRLGRRVLFDPSRLAKWLNEHHVEPDEQGSSRR